jgi:hypothetical protein
VRQVKLVALVLLVWTVLSVPVGILVGKVLKANREAMEAADPPEPPEWVNQESKVLRVYPARKANGASLDLPANPASPSKDRLDP